MTDRVARLSTPLLLFVLFFALYRRMAAPGLDWGDAGEAQLAAWTAGLSHPTGYPLFLVLGWIWSHLLAAFGVAPTRAVTLFSALCGAAAVAVSAPATAALLRRWLPAGAFPRVAPTAVAVLFGFSPTFWSQALLAEVYTFHILLLVLFLWALWSIPADPGAGSPARPALAAFLCGLFLSHHRTALLWLPGLLLWLWLEARHLLRPPALLRLLGWALLPQLAYLYIALRGPVAPYLHQPVAGGELLNLYDGSPRAFVDHVLGTVFAADVGLREPLSNRLAGVWRLLAADLGVALLALVPFAFLAPRRTIRAVSRTSRAADFILLISGALLTILFGVLYAIGDVEVMFIPAWLALSWLAALGALRLVRLNPRSGTLLVVLLLFWAGWTRLQGAPESRAGHTAPRERVTSLLAAQPPADAILVTNDRNEIVPFWYAQFAEGARRDLLVVAPLITQRPEHEHVTLLTGWALDTGRPVFLTKEMPGLSLRYDLESATPPLLRVIGSAVLPETPPLEGALAPDLAVTAWTPPAELKPGESVIVPVALLPASPLDVPLTFSLQLFDDSGERIAQHDVAPDPFYPPDEWRPGEPLRQRFTLSLPGSLPEGPYAWRLSAYLLAADGDVTPYGAQVTLGDSP